MGTGSDNFTRAIASSNAAMDTLRSRFEGMSPEEISRKAKQNIIETNKTLHSSLLLGATTVNEQSTNIAQFAAEIVLHARRCQVIPSDKAFRELVDFLDATLREAKLALKEVGK